MPFDSDRMYCADFARVGQAGMAVITKLQNYTSEQQVLAAALVFKTIAEKFNVRPTDALEAAGRIFEKEQHQSIELRAMHTYVEKEIA